MLQNNRIWLVGRSGRLGSALEHLLHEKEYRLYPTDIEDIDVTDFEKVEIFAERIRPDIIINCAAKRDRLWCKENPEEAYRLHAIGGRNLAIVADEIGAHLFYLSSDFVFDGRSNTPYNEFDLVLPQTIYGKSKVSGENFVRTHCSRHTIFRSSWLYGKKTLRRFIDQGRKEGKVTLASKITGSPTSSLEVAEMVMHFIDTSQYGTFHVSAEGECSIVEWVEEILSLTGVDAQVSIEGEAHPFEALRPSYSVLDNLMLRLTRQPPMKTWQDGLARFIKERKVGREV